MTWAQAFVLIEIGSFLAVEGRFDGYAACFRREGDGPFPDYCANMQMENLDAWVDWRGSVDPVNLVAFALESWYGGDCVVARFISRLDFEGCSTSDIPSQMMEYEVLMEADVSLGECEDSPPTNRVPTTLSCEVSYSNIMNLAVGKPLSVTVREFTVSSEFIVGRPSGPAPWYSGDYPEHSELRDSFRMFAESGDLQAEYGEASCASARSPVCANLILDNLDDWAAWYETNARLPGEKLDPLRLERFHYRSCVVGSV